METSIKIVKRKQRELSAEEQPVAGGFRTDNQLRRELARTVTSWIEERRTKCLAGVSEAFNSPNKAPQ